MMNTLLSNEATGEDL